MHRSTKIRDTRNTDGRILITRRNGEITRNITMSGVMPIGRRNGKVGRIIMIIIMETNGMDTTVKSIMLRNIMVIIIRKVVVVDINIITVMATKREENMNTKVTAINMVVVDTIKV